MDSRDIWRRPPSPLSNALFYYPNTCKTSDSAVSLSCILHMKVTWKQFLMRLWVTAILSEACGSVYTCHPGLSCCFMAVVMAMAYPPAVDRLIVLPRAIKALLWPHTGIVRDECRVDPLGFERGPLSPPSNRISTGSDFPPVSVSDGCCASAQGHFKVGEV